MSLLADLLSKIQQPQSKREIPPNLKNIVQTAARRSSDKKKIIVLSGLFIVSVLSGLFIVYLIRSLTENSGSGITVSSPAIVAEVNRQEVSIQDKSGIRSQSNSEEQTRPDKADMTIPPNEIEKESENEPPVEREPVQEKMIEADETGTSAIPDKTNKVEVKVEIAEKQQFATIKSEKSNSAERDAYLYSAREYEMNKDYSNALANYKKALETDTDNYVIMNNIAFLYMQLNLIEESVKYSQMTLDINKDYVPALINIGIAYARTDNIPPAKTAFKRALELKPDSQSVILNLAILHERQKDYSEASKFYTQLIRSGNVKGSLGLARIYEKQEKIEEALRIYRNIHYLDSLDRKTRALVSQRIKVLYRLLNLPPVKFQKKPE